MNTTTERDNPFEPLRALHPRRAVNSLVGAAKKITKRSVHGKRTGTAAGWQEDAWDMYNQVGEQRFLSNTLAGRMSQARFYVGESSDDPTEEIPATENEAAKAVLEAFGGGQEGRTQILARMGVNLFISGEGWIIGVPRDLMQAEEDRPAGSPKAPPVRGPGPAATPTGIPPIGRSPDTGQADEDLPPDVDLADLEWIMASVREVSFREDEIVIDRGDDVKITAELHDVIAIRIWRPHPARFAEADSPTRSSLPVLRELVGLTMHVGAQVDSRLAGAGVLLVPAEAKDAILQSSDPDDFVEDDDPFTDALIESMITPINERDNASALVPLVLTVPGETVQNFRHISFASPLDPEAQALREEAIRRLALGQDAPPEVLLGTGGMNHWGAWLVREDTVTTHIEPPLALICDALTEQYLRPVLRQQGMSEEQADRYSVEYDVSHLIMRPNRTQDAFELHGRGVISDESVRDASGFGDSDAPDVTVEEETDPAVQLALDMLRSAPSLAKDPGLEELVRQIRAVTGEGPAGPPGPVPPLPPPGEDEEPPTGGDELPDEDDTAGPPDESREPEPVASSAAARVVNGHDDDYESWRARFTPGGDGAR